MAKQTIEQSPQNPHPKLIDLGFVGAIDSIAYGVGMTYHVKLLLCITDGAWTKSVSQPVRVTPHTLTKLVEQHIGYIAGADDGIVTVDGKPCVREILLANANAIHDGFTHRTFSLPNGHYLFTNLDPNQAYLIMARDFKKQYEPCVYDYIRPATDLSHDEQLLMWQGWQGN